MQEQWTTNRWACARLYTDFSLSVTQRLSASDVSVMDASEWNIFASQLFGRTVKASIAIDNGRAAEFIRRRNYTDKSRCYECGVSKYLLFTFLTKVRNAIVIVFLYFHNGTCQDSGHLSYACPKNMLGEREPPKKKEKKKKKKAQQPEQTYVICDIYICATEYITVHLHFYFFYFFYF